MKELENKEISQIRFEFIDGTWFILDHHSLNHLKRETRQEVDFALSKAFEEIEAKRLLSLEKNNPENHLSIETKENINIKDRMF